MGYNVSLIAGSAEDRTLCVEEKAKIIAESASLNEIDGSAGSSRELLRI